MDAMEMILEKLDKMERKIDNLQSEISEVKKEMKEEIKEVRSNLGEVRQICRGIEEKSQFWGALKERIDAVSYNNENLRYEINRNFVRKENIVQELKKAL
ncbi:MAG: hypothetical protein Q4A78_02265 [Peptostreptococcaceae bacterium]|nr:hypothetical protein [Peptostreptococcaceae bacterium]